MTGHFTWCGACGRSPRKGPALCRALGAGSAIGSGGLTAGSRPGAAALGPGPGAGTRKALRAKSAPVGPARVVHEPLPLP
jgi:hypothetical protein